MSKISPPPPDIIQQHIFVVKIYKRNDGKFFHTVAKDAIRIIASEDYNSKQECLEGVFKYDNIDKK